VTGDRRLGPVSDVWTVAIHVSESDWKPVGTGVLIDGRRVLTCAHVVTKARAGTSDFFVAFPKVETVPVRLRVASVVLPDGPPQELADVAVLVLESAAPEGVVPAPLRDPPTAGLVDGQWWAFGYPNSDVLGSTAHGQVDAALSYGWVRLRTDSAYVVEQGFSGAGLWSPAYQAVVGLVGQAQVADEHRGDARALTLRQISTWLPEVKLDALTGWSAAAAGEGALASWGWRLADDPESGRHWMPRARGVSRHSERGFRFRGRTVALSEVVAWLGREVPDRCALVVTGSPGAGKSAVLGRIVTTADAGIRAALPADDVAVKAPVGSVACAVHAKGKTALEVAVEIARAASVPLPTRVEDLAPALQMELDRRPVRDRRFNVVIDALDEASSPADARLIVTGIVLPFVQSGSAGVQVVVGSRYRDDGGDLIGVFGYAKCLLDLDHPENFAEADLVDYVLATLQSEGDERPGNPYADRAVGQPVAARIAQLAQKSFLVAGLIARMHGLHDSAPVAVEDIAFAPSVDDALRRYLEYLKPVDGISAATMLTVLAFAEAPGLTTTLWRLGLHALGADLDEGRLAAFARSAAANFLIETGRQTPATGGRQTSYRLFHQALNDALLAARADLHPRPVDEHALTQVWYRHGRDIGWANADTYLLRSLPAHAAASALTEQLLLDDDYLCHTDLHRLLPHTDSVTTEPGRNRARMVHLTPHAIPARPALRAAMFHLTTTMERLHPPFPDHTHTPYRALWAAVTPRTERNTLSGHTRPVNAVCVIPAEGGRHLLASASDDDTVRVWDPASGQLVHTLTGHTDRVNAVCVIPAEGGRHLLASADSGGSVRVWDPASGQLVHTLTGHTGSVTAVCVIPAEGGRHLLASADSGGSVRVWDPASGQLVHTLTGHTDWVNAVCVIPAEGGRHLLASASNDDTVRVWDSVSGQLVHTLTGHTNWVGTLAVLLLGDRHVLVSGGDDQTMRLSDPTTGQQIQVIHVHHWVTCCCTADTTVLVGLNTGLLALQIQDQSPSPTTP
jgi:sugar lactone lactonase YvrE